MAGQHSFLIIVHMYKRVMASASPARSGVRAVASMYRHRFKMNTIEPYFVTVRMYKRVMASASPAPSGCIDTDSG